MIEVLFYSALYLVLFGFTDLLYHRFGVKADNTRKIVHISTGLIALSFPHFLSSFWQVLVLCCSFLALMALSEKFSWFKSITAVERKSYGSWLFALVVLVCFYLQLHLGSTLYFYLPILVLSFSDPLAATIGKRLNFIPLMVWGSKKTIGGSIAFLISCSLIFLAFHIWNDLSWPWWYFVLCSTAVTMLELVSIKGWDNLTIPLGVVSCVYLASIYF